ncbi:MAG: GFA family protein [Solirubrobacterales bacterium]|nr:GFA family protein [Solirubrobacterales bacterium]
MSELPLTGGCNCGAVRYEVTEPLLSASYCHCRRCQHRTGAAASPNAHPAPGSFRITAGQDELRVWQPEGGGEKWFCGHCGSSIYAHNPRHPDSIGIRMGTFDHDPGIKPSARQFVTYAARWEPIPNDGLARHPESRHPPATPPSH